MTNGSIRRRRRRRCDATHVPLAERCAPTAVLFKFDCFGRIARNHHCADAACVAPHVACVRGLCACAVGGVA